MMVGRPTPIPTPNAIISLVESFEEDDDEDDDDEVEDEGGVEVEFEVDAEEEEDGVRVVLPTLAALLLKVPVVTAPAPFPVGDDAASVAPATAATTTVDVAVTVPSSNVPASVCWLHVSNTAAISPVKRAKHVSERYQSITPSCWPQTVSEKARSWTLPDVQGTEEWEMEPRPVVTRQISTSTETSAWRGEALAQ